MDSLYWGNGWMWDDDPATDFPYMTPLVINDAAVKVVVDPTTVGNKPEVSFIPDLFKPNFINNAVSVKGDSSDLAVTRDWLHNSDKIIVRDSVGIDDEPDTTAINLSRTNNYFLSEAVLRPFFWML